MRCVDTWRMKLADLEKIEVKETLFGVRYIHEPDEDETGSPEPRWHLTGANVSEMWKFTFTEGWHSRVYSKYYLEFWKPLLDELDGREKPVEITMDMVYEFGVMSEEKIKEYMLATTKGPCFLIMHRDEEGVSDPSMTNALVRGYTITELENVPDEIRKTEGDRGTP